MCLGENYFVLTHRHKAQTHYLHAISAGRFQKEVSGEVSCSTIMMDPNSKQEKCELTAEAVEYLQQLKVEKENIDPSYAIACRLMNEEIDRVERGAKYTEVHNDKKVKLQEKVLIPVKEHPKFNFVGKLLGPQGNSLKRLQAETGCKMSILGKGSMRDKNKEDELRKGNDPKYQHLNYELHVLVEVFSTPIDAHARMSHALVELRKFLVPDYNDEIRQQQLQELMYINGDDGVPIAQPGPPPVRGRGRGRGMPPGGPPTRGRGGALLATPPVRGAPASRGMMPPRGSPRGAPAPRARGAGRGLVRPPPPVAPPVYEEDYSYGAEYDDQYAYGETYDDSYAAGSGDIYDYGHGSGSAREPAYDDGYSDNSYAEGWGNGVSSKPAPLGKMSSFRGTGRAHPYGGGARGARY